MGKWIRSVHWGFIVIACLTLGLAPFVPVPHVVEKLGMLVDGRLSRAIDIFDLGFHGLPWLLLAAKGVTTALDLYSKDDKEGDGAAG